MAESILSAVVALRPELDPALFTAAGTQAGELYGNAFAEAATARMAETGADVGAAGAVEGAEAGTGAAAGAGAAGSSGAEDAALGGTAGAGAAEEDGATYAKNTAITGADGDVAAGAAGGESSGGSHLLAIGAVVGVLGGGLDLIEKSQTAIANIQTATGVTRKQATELSDSLSKFSQKTIYDGETIVSAYAGVAGALKTTEGHVLSNAEGLKVMKAATDLATASNQDLNTSTQDISETLTAFHEKISGSNGVANVLYNVATATGQVPDMIASSLIKIKTHLGALSPSLGQLGGLAVDFQQHGVTGRTATTAETALLEKSLTDAANVKKAHDQLNVSLKNLPPSLQAIAQDYANNTISSKMYSEVTSVMTTGQRALLGSFTSNLAAYKKAQLAQQANGITATTLTGILDQLGEKIKGMSQHQATLTLESLGYGSASAEIVGVIQAGTPALTKYTDQVTKTNSAHKAAIIMAKTLHDQIAKLISTVKNFAESLATTVLPLIESWIKDLTHWANDLNKFTGYLDKHKSALKAVGDVIKAILIPALLLLSYVKLTGLIDSVKAFWTALDFNPYALGIMAVIVIAYLIIKHWSEVKKFFVALWDGIKDVFHEAVRWVGMVLMGEFMPEYLIFKYWTPISHFFEHLWDEVWSFIKKATEKIAEVLFLFTPEGLIYKYWRPVVHFFEKLWDGVYDGAKKIVMDIVHFFENLPEMIVHALESGAGLVGKALEDLIPAPLRGIVGGAVHDASDLWGDITGHHSSPTPATAGTTITNNYHQTNNIPTTASASDVAKHIDRLGKKMTSRQPQTIRGAG